MLIKRSDKFFITGSARHFRQGLEYLFFRIIDVLQAIQKQIIERFLTSHLRLLE